MERSIKKEQIATVVSDKMQKTVVVATKTHIKHPRYGKYYVRRAKFPAHDESGMAQLGDVVRVRQSRPMSKTKNWVVIEVIRKAALREGPSSKYVELEAAGEAS